VGLFWVVFIGAGRAGDPGGPSHLVISGLGERLLEGLGLVVGDPGNQDLARRWPHFPYNGHSVLGALAFGEYHFCGALPERPVVVDLGEAEVGEWKLDQFL